MPRLIATFFYVGRLPYAPGTWASSVALALAWFIAQHFGAGMVVAAGLFATGIGVWASKHYALLRGDEDPSDCVIDEVAGQLFACAFAPLTIAGYAVAFALFRFFDITKIWPVSWGESLPGGTGVMMDDVIAGLLSATIIIALVQLGIL